MDKIVYRKIKNGEQIREGDKVWLKDVAAQFDPKEANYTSIMDDPARIVLAQDWRSFDYYRPIVLRVDEDDRRLEPEL